MLQRGERFLVIVNGSDPRNRFKPVIFAALLHAANLRNTFFDSRHQNFLKQFANDLVAERSHADFFALLDELANHARTSERLAGARRSLDREDGAIERADDATRGCLWPFARQRHQRFAVKKARRFAEE